MIVYQTDSDGFFVGQVKADKSPLEPDVFLVPRGCVDEAPPLAKPGKRAKWTGSVWKLVDFAPATEDAATVRPSSKTQITMRQLLLGMMIDKLITSAEAEAWAMRTSLPSIVNAVVDALPEEERSAARVAAFTMTMVGRNDPMLFSFMQMAMPDSDSARISSALDGSFEKWSGL